MNLEHLKFPAATPQIYTKMMFKEYSRGTPSTPARITNTASIVLPIPHDIRDQYGIRIDAPDLHTAGYLADSIARGSSIADVALQAVRGTAGIIRAATSISATDALAFGAVSPLGDVLAPSLRSALLSQLGVVRNPQTTAMFEGMNLKQFFFQWKVSPRNEAESNEIHNIIYKIKERFHPKTRFNGYALDYPDLCSLSFVSRSEGTLERLPKVNNAFVFYFDADYVGSTAPAFFRNNDPVTMQISMGLHEITIRTREDIIASRVRT